MFEHAYTDIVQFNGNVSYRHVTDNGHTQYGDTTLESIPYIHTPQGWVPDNLSIQEALSYWREVIGE